VSHVSDPGQFGGTLIAVCLTGVTGYNYVQQFIDSLEFLYFKLHNQQFSLIINQCHQLTKDNAKKNNQPDNYSLSTISYCG